MPRHALPLLFAAGLFLIVTVPPCAARTATTAAPAAASLAPRPLSPNPRQGLVEEAVAGILNQYHYGKPQSEEELSQQIFRHYLEDLDPNRSYFLQSDIDSFAGYRNGLARAIQKGELKPAFSIYNVYQQRVAERIRYAEALLQHAPDLTRTEDYVFDRRHAPWAADTSELDAIWRKRVKNDVIGLLLAGKSWPQAQEILRKRYRNFAYRIRQVSNADVFDLFMNSYTRSLDPHTNYFSPDQSQQFQIQMSLKLEGIGAALVSDGEYTKVNSVIPGGPAARSRQLHPDDRITAVGQGDKGDMVDVVGWRLDDVVQLIRGPAGTVVRLQILPAGAAPGSPERVLRLVRDTVKLEAQAAHKSLIVIQRGKKPYRIGVITLPTFYSDFRGRLEGEKNYTSTTRDVRRLLEQLAADHVDGVVLDLRNNGGGSLLEAEQLTGLFIPQGPVVQIRDSSGNVSVETDRGSHLAYRGPLAVLVNRFTASASEIFAAAIQDYHRGLIVGSLTYGKGTVQTLIDLGHFVPGDDDPGQLKLTVDKFYRVNGASTQDRGVMPDILLPSPIDPKEFGEATQDDALPWDSIAPAGYHPLHLGIEQALPELLKQHDARLARSPEWKLYGEELRLVEAQRGRKSVSLMLKERQKQRAAEDRERLALANAWRALKGLPPAASLQAAYQAVRAAARTRQPAAGGNAAATAAASTPAQSADQGPNLEPDVLLDETASIVADMAALGVGSLPADSQAALFPQAERLTRGQGPPAQPCGTGPVPALAIR